MRRVNIYNPVTRFRVWPIPLGSYCLMFVALSCQGHSQDCSRGRNLSEGSQGHCCGSDWGTRLVLAVRSGSGCCPITAAPTAPTQPLRPSSSGKGHKALKSPPKLSLALFSSWGMAPSALTAVCCSPERGSVTKI